MSAEDARVNDLSRQELVVLALMSQGLSNAAIQARLVVSPKTVETHVRSIYGKLGLERDEVHHRRVQAVLLYVRSRPVLRRVA